MRKVGLSLLLALLMLAALCLPGTARAEDSTVRYVGGAEKFVLPEGGSLFRNFGGVMPGDTLTQKITVRNDSSASDCVKIYLRAESAEADALTEQFLSLLHMTVRSGDRILYDASPDQTAGLTENVPIGTIRKGESLELTVTLTVPAELGNEYADRSGNVNWVFTADELNLDPELTLSKIVSGRSADGKAYTVGETIHYRITAANTGNVLLKDVVVTDDLTGGSWTIPELKPGEEQSFDTAYTVTQEDVRAGSVTNVASASATPDNPDLPATTCDPAEAVAPTAARAGHMTLQKETVGDAGFGTGDTVRFRITVTNDGEAPLVNIRVDDDLTGGQWTLARLEPGESESFETAYRITEGDAARRSVRNTATAAAENADDGSAVTAEVSCRVTVSPDTGDGARPVLWLVLLTVSGCAAALLMTRRRRDA